VRREELFEFDVVIFGDVNPSFLSTSVLANLNEFVEKKGGGVAFISGPRYSGEADESLLSTARYTRTVQ
jgi:hypothetical protein